MTNSRTSSCASNLWVTPFYSQYWPSTGLHMIILEPWDGTTIPINSGNTGVLILPREDTGHITNHPQTIRIYHTINPSTSTTVRITSDAKTTQPKLNLDNYVLHRRYSRFQRLQPNWTCYPGTYMDTDTLNILYRHNRSFFTIVIFLYMLISPVPASHLSRVCQGSIRTKPHNY